MYQVMNSLSDPARFRAHVLEVIQYHKQCLRESRGKLLQVSEHLIW